MEKEQILSTLNEKLGQTSFSEKTINDYVDAFIPESEEAPDFDKHVGFLKSLYGNYSADVAKQVNEAKEKLKAQPLKEGEGDDKRYSALEEKFDKLMKDHKALTELLAEKESKQTQQQLMSQVKAEMKKQGATDEYVLKQTLKGVTLDTKKSVEDLTKEMLTAYDSEYTACRGKGAAPRNGEQGGGGSKGKTDADNYFANKKKREGWANTQNK
ncbi:MAG: hypothetical protein K2M94_03990 [Paramuribaculum sp.]|nr:hypothetical protein [Paramuribaculum sp.]